MAQDQSRATAYPSHFYVQDMSFIIKHAYASSNSISFLLFHFKGVSPPLPLPTSASVKPCDKNISQTVLGFGNFLKHIWHH